MYVINGLMFRIGLQLPKFFGSRQTVEKPLEGVDSESSPLRYFVSSSFKRASLLSTT